MGGGSSRIKVFSDGQNHSEPSPILHNNQSHIVLKDKWQVTSHIHRSFICRFCGGKSCKREDWKTQEDKPAIEGLHSTWVSANVLAMQRPSNRLIKTYSIIQQFQKMNIHAIINVQLAGEHALCGDGILAAGFSYDPELFMNAGIYFYNFGWVDMSVPSLAHMLAIVQIMSYHVDKQQRVAIHCHAGFGRTGLACACFFVYAYGLSAKLAIDSVRERRKGCIQTKKQQTFVHKFADYVNHLRIVYVSTPSHAYTLKQHLHRQLTCLHGPELKALQFKPKIIDSVCNRLTLACNTFGPLYIASCFIDGFRHLSPSTTEAYYFALAPPPPKNPTAASPNVPTISNFAGSVPGSQRTNNNGNNGNNSNPANGTQRASTPTVVDHRDEGGELPGSVRPDSNNIFSNNQSDNNASQVPSYAPWLEYDNNLEKMRDPKWSLMHEDTLGTIKTRINVGDYTAIPSTDPRYLTQLIFDFLDQLQSPVLPFHSVVSSNQNNANSNGNGNNANNGPGNGNQAQSGGSPDNNNPIGASTTSYQSFSLPAVSTTLTMLNKTSFQTIQSLFSLMFILINVGQPHLTYRLYLRMFAALTHSTLTPIPDTCIVRLPAFGGTKTGVVDPVRADACINWMIAFMDAWPAYEQQVLAAEAAKKKGAVGIISNHDKPTTSHVPTTANNVVVINPNIANLSAPVDDQSNDKDVIRPLPRTFIPDEPNEKLNMISADPESLMSIDQETNIQYLKEKQEDHHRKIKLTHKHHDVKHNKDEMEMNPNTVHENDDQGHLSVKIKSNLPSPHHLEILPLHPIVNTNTNAFVESIKIKNSSASPMNASRSNPLNQAQSPILNENEMIHSPPGQASENSNESLLSRKTVIRVKSRVAPNASGAIDPKNHPDQLDQLYSPSIPNHSNPTTSTNHTIIVQTPRSKTHNMLVSNNNPPISVTSHNNDAIGQENNAHKSDENTGSGTGHLALNAPLPVSVVEEVVINSELSTSNYNNLDNVNLDKNPTKLDLHTSPSPDDLQNFQSQNL